MADPRKRRVVREQRRNLSDRKHEHEIEEQLARRDAVLMFNGRNRHARDPTPRLLVQRPSAATRRAPACFGVYRRSGLVECCPP